MQISEVYFRKKNSEISSLAELAGKKANFIVKIQKVLNLLTTYVTFSSII